MPVGDITQLLHAYSAGEASALDRLLPLVYDEMRLAAHRQLRKRRPGQTLDTSALVHDAYLKLVDQQQAGWRDRNHFMAVATLAMRQILVDTARRRRAQKRGGDEAPVTLDEGRIGQAESLAIEVLALDEALEKLSQLDPRLTKLVELRFFGGLTVEETAAVLDLSERTVKRDWRKARAFLVQQLDSGSAA